MFDHYLRVRQSRTNCGRLKKVNAPLRGTTFQNKFATCFECFSCVTWKEERERALESGEHLKSSHGRQPRPLAVPRPRDRELHERLAHLPAGQNRAEGPAHFVPWVVRKRANLVDRKIQPTLRNSIWFDRCWLNFVWYDWHLLDGWPRFHECL